jgi:hypothetical protein
MLKYFIFGSSILSTIITLTYVGNAFFRAGRPSEIPYELFAIFIPILFGIFNVIIMYFVKKYNNNNLAFLIGGIMGLIFSLIGRFKLNLPIKIFNFNTSNAHLVHIIAFIMYGTIFRFGIINLNKLI